MAKGLMVLFMVLSLGAGAQTFHQVVVKVNQPDACKSLNTNKDMNKLWVYPNPADDYVTVRDIEAGDRLYLFNSVGQLVSERRAIFFEDYKMKIIHLPDGLYIMKVESGGTYKSAIIKVKHK